MKLCRSVTGTDDRGYCNSSPCTSYRRDKKPKSHSEALLQATGSSHPGRILQALVGRDLLYLEKELTSGLGSRANTVGLHSQCDTCEIF